MRIRQMSSDGDMSFGASARNFLVNSPEAVAQLILTRLRLLQGEWFVNTLAGVPYATDVLGVNTAPTRNVAIRNTILQTPGVLRIVPGTYSSTVTGRAFSVAARVDTIYGQAEIAESL